MIKPFTIVCCIIMAIACSKDSDSDDKTAPSITLTSPANSATFNAGDNIQIQGTVADDTKVAELHIHVSNNTTGVLLVDIHRYPNAGNYQINESVVASAGIDYKIQVIAADKTGKQGIETVFVSGN